ncbi:MAG: DUF1211 domain-containing protein [Ruminococcus sp.]|nr:DUF1211 domain-containing protein [Ruminococcus sp.]
MNKSRLEAFTDAIVAIAATIMVLELKTPLTNDLEGTMNNVKKAVIRIKSVINGDEMNNEYIGELRDD